MGERGRRSPVAAPGGGGTDPPQPWSPPEPLLRVCDSRRGALRVERGERVSLAGASGAGKTRWVRSLLGLEDPFDVALFDGAPLAAGGAGGAVGWVPDGDGVLLSETTLANVTLPVGMSVSTPRAMDALDMVGLASRAAEPVGNLSRNQRRRVALARCIARRARFLVIDGELDSVLWPLFPSLCAHLDWVEGVLVAQSSLDEVAAAASTVALISDGAIVAQDTLAGLRAADHPALRQFGP